MLLDFHSEIYSLIRGGVFILFIYHLLIFLQNKSRLYLYYSLYLFVLTVYLFQNLFLEDLNPLRLYLNFSIQFLAYAFYIAFGRELVDSRNLLISWDKYFEISIKILLVLVPVFALIQFLFGFDFQIMAFKIVAPMLTVFALIALFIIYKKIKTPATTYFIIGSIIYAIFANISYFELIVGEEFFVNIGINSMFFFYAGLLFQSLIFSIINGTIIKKIEQKSKNAEIKLAVKLKEMEELKMTALQSQMNPHFLFNSLNSINNFVLKNDIEKASDYITKFSKLIRVILNSSTSPTAMLSEELEILALYVKLEQMRVSGGFSYEVNVDKKLNVSVIKVPPLFLQPFIENSIWHGIMKKKGEKKIEISIKEDKGDVLCIVKDNGIGINKAKKLAAHISQRKRFFGAKITENRINILHQNKDVHITTKDISSKTQTGTQVSIRFPH